MRRIHLIVVLAVLGLAALESSAEATLALSVDPAKGSRDIRFETVRPGQPARNEDVRFSVQNDEPGRRYQITYSLSSPITSDRGQVLPPDRIKIFSPTNVSGTLRAALPVPLRIGTEVLYTSDPAGAGVVFDIVFAFETAESAFGGKPSAGIYRTQIVYTLAAVDGGPAPVTVVQNLQIEIESDFEVRIRNRRGAEALDLGRVSPEAPGGEEVLNIEVLSNNGRPYRITQALGRLQNATGDSLDSEKISFEASGGRRGTLTESPQVLLSSDMRGGEGASTVVYRLTDADSQTAGEYRSVLNLSVELDGVPVRTINLPVHIEILPVFKLVVDYDGGGMIRFGQFKPGDNVKTKEVRLAVFNNTGKQYQITQVAEGPMASTTGKLIPENNFTVEVSGPRERSFLASAKSPVQKGNTVLFVSNSRGEASELSVVYELIIGTEQIKGDYTTNITYSLSTT